MDPFDHYAIGWKDLAKYLSIIVVFSQLVFLLLLQGSETFNEISRKGKLQRCCTRTIQFLQK